MRAAGTIHETDLVAWTEASGAWGLSIFGGGNADMMDAIATATVRSHESHTIMWDMMDLEGQLLPDGEYVAVLEVTEDRAARPGPTVRIPFTKGHTPVMMDMPDQEGFSGVSLSYTP